MLLCGCQGTQVGCLGVSMRLLRYSGWLLVWLLGYPGWFGWLLECCYEDRSNLTQFYRMTHQTEPKYLEYTGRHRRCIVVLCCTWISQSGRTLSGVERERRSHCVVFLCSQRPEARRSPSERPSGCSGVWSSITPSQCRTPEEPPARSWCPSGPSSP